MPNTETLEAEEQITGDGRTLGEINRDAHNFIAVNQETESLETEHLRYEKGRGVVKIEEATCSLCEEWGLNDGRWHPVPPPTAQEAA